MFFQRTFPNRLTLLLCSTFVAAAASATNATAAGPTDVNPAALFDVRPQQDLMALRDAAAADLDAAVPLIGELETNANEKNWNQLFAKVAKAHIGLLRAERIADRLALWNEPAGIDLRMRVDAARRRLSANVDLRQTQPGVQTQVALLVANFPLKAKKVLASAGAKQVVRLHKEQKFEEARDALFALEEPLEASIVWHGHNKVGEPMKPFDEEEAKIRNDLDPVQRAEMAEKLAALRHEAAPDLQALLAQATEAVKSVAANGQATINQKLVEGPQAILELAALWHDAQARTMRTRAIDWARLNVDDKARGELSDLESQYGELARTMPAKMLDLIRADTARLTPAEIAPRYRDYLAAAAAVLAERSVPADASSDTFPTDLATALDQMAAKSPELQTAVTQYRLATDDLLRWRERTAKSYAHFHSAGSSPVGKLFAEGAKPEGTSRGMVSSGAATAAGAELLDPATVVIPVLAKKTIGAAATVEQVVGLLPADGLGGRVPRSAYRDRCYATVVWPGNLQAAAARLRSDLLAGPGLDPLTLTAAAALATADRGIADSAGGKIVGLELEGLMPRFAGLEPTDPLVRIGSLPQEQVQRPAQEVLVRFTLEPAWIAHRYFVVVKE